MHRLDETRPEALNGVGAGLVARLPGRDVPADFLLFERRDPDAALLDRRDLGPASLRSDTAVTTQCSRAREPSEHGGGFGVVARLSENGAVDQDERVRGQDPLLRMERGRGGGLRAGETGGRFPTGFAREEGLVDVSGGNVERDSERAEDLRAAGRGGGEDEAEGGIPSADSLLSFRGAERRGIFPETTGDPSLRSG